MPSDDPKSMGTEETPARKISLIKVDGGSGKVPKGVGVNGWEYAPPMMGEPYLIHLHEGMVLKTSPIQNLQETRGGVIITTLNSVYHVKYVAEDSGE